MTLHRRQRWKTGSNSYVNVSDNRVTSTAFKSGNTTITTKLGGGTTITRNLGDGYYDKTYIKAAKPPRVKNARRSSKADADDGEMFIFIVGLVLLSPILYVTYICYQHISNDWQWHPLFAGLVSAIPTIAGIALILSSKIFRAIYFGAETIVASLLIYHQVQLSYDAIWGACAAIVALAIGFSLTKLAVDED